MTDHRLTTDTTTDDRAASDGGGKTSRIGRSMGGTGLSAWRAQVRSLEEAEQRYVEARDGWTAAMRAANSGRPADLANLAIAQEAYEAAVAERDRWQSGARVAIPVDAAADRDPIEVVVGQELAWRQVHRPEGEEAPPRGLIGRIFGRRRG